jgi:putative membrane protein
MWHGMNGWGGMWFGWIFWLVIIALAVWIVARLAASGRAGNRGSDYKRETPLDILKKRYARGEISKEQFENMKKDLES